MKNREEILEDFGLSKNKAKVYLALLRLGSTTAENVSKVSGIHRRNVYDALEGLIGLGLVSYVLKDKKKMFKATNPYYLLEILESEKEKIKEKKVSVTSILSELLQIQKLPKEEDIVTLYKGVNGIRAILNDVLKTRKENLVLGAHKPPKPIKNFLDSFHEKRIKLGIQEKMIFNQNDEKRAKRLADLPLTKIKFLPKRINSGTAINIYGNKVAILMWSEPFGILIDKRNVAETFREYFKLLWNHCNGGN